MDTNNTEVTQQTDKSNQKTGSDFPVSKFAFIAVGAIIVVSVGTGIVLNQQGNNTSNNRALQSPQISVSQTNFDTLLQDADTDLSEVDNIDLTKDDSY